MASSVTRKNWVCQAGWEVERLCILQNLDFWFFLKNQNLWPHRASSAVGSNQPSNQLAACPPVHHRPLDHVSLTLIPRAPFVPLLGEMRWSEGHTGETEPGPKWEPSKCHHGLYHTASLVVVQLLSHVWLFVTPWTAARQASLSFTISWSFLKLMSIELIMPSNHLTFCCPLLLLPSIFPSIRVFSNESVLHIKWPKYWSFSFSISPSIEYWALISFRIDWLVGSPCSPRAFQESSPTPQFKSINSSALSFLYSPPLTSIYDYWKKYSFD